MLKNIASNLLVKKIGAHWAKQRTESRPLRTRWWESALVVSHYNAQICGDYIPGTSQGIISYLKKNYAAMLPFKKGISVAGSNGWKERILLKAGIVEHFTVTEYSEPLIEEGIKLSAQEGLSTQIEFFYGDAFEKYFAAESYDFVYWDNSLHHMLDVYDAVAWSKNILMPDGLFVMNDFIGPTRMQFTDQSLANSSIGRAFLPERYLRSPYKPWLSVERNVKRCNPVVLAASDPSECADSGRILSAVEHYFPQAKTIYTGGVIYNSSLNDILANFSEADETDCCILRLLLQLDRQFALAGDSHYAFSVAQKN